MNQTPDFTVKTTDTVVEITPQTDKAKEWMWEEFGHGAAACVVSPNGLDYWVTVKLSQFTVEISK